MNQNIFSKSVFLLVFLFCFFSFSNSINASDTCPVGPNCGGGSVTVDVPADFSGGSFSVTVSGSGNTSASLNINLSVPTQSVPGAPIVDFRATPPDIAYGGQTVLSWSVTAGSVAGLESKNQFAQVIKSFSESLGLSQKLAQASTVTCIASGSAPWPNTQKAMPSGSETISNITQTSSYTMTCTDSRAPLTPTVKTITVNVGAQTGAPSGSISASPNPCFFPTTGPQQCTSVVSWTSTNTTNVAVYVKAPTTSGLGINIQGCSSTGTNGTTGTNSPNYIVKDPVNFYLYNCVNGQVSEPALSEVSVTGKSATALPVTTYSWSYGAWSPTTCPVSATLTTQTRTAVCKSSADVTVADSFCTDTKEVSKDCAVLEPLGITGCGTAHGVPTATAPSQNLCSVGYTNSLYGVNGPSYGTYFWWCVNNSTGQWNQTCTAPIPVSAPGQCNSAITSKYWGDVAGGPTGNLCSVGTPTTPRNEGEGVYSYNCSGTGTPAGMSATCYTSSAITTCSFNATPDKANVGQGKTTTLRWSSSSCDTFATYKEVEPENLSGLPYYSIPNSGGKMGPYLSYYFPSYVPNGSGSLSGVGAGTYHFIAWGAPYAGHTGTAYRTVTIGTGNPQSTLTVTKSLGGTVTSNIIGISCGVDCTEDYDQGTTVVLSAQPISSGWKFVGWTGDCAGKGVNTCSLVMSQNRTVSARFLPVLESLKEF